MDKRRGRIITDLNDDRLFPDEVKEEGEALDFSLTITQASSLFIICNAALPNLADQIGQLQAKLKAGEKPDDITDALYVLGEVVKDAELIKKEVAELINELEQ